jgi:hypothetical protein
MRGVEPVLVTERLALRWFTAADASGLLALDGDPAVMRFLDCATRTLAEIEAEGLPRFLGYYQRYRDSGFIDPVGHACDEPAGVTHEFQDL